MGVNYRRESLNWKRKPSQHDYKIMNKQVTNGGLS